MEKSTWKTIAVIFIILFTLENIWIGYGIHILNVEEEETLKCYYDVCADNADASYVGGLCTCYDYDVMGNPIETKYKIFD